MSNERAFRGVWIPADIWTNRDLSLQEKVMLIEIDSLQHPERGCFKTNAKLAEFFGLSPSRVSRVISKLETDGWLRVEHVREGKQIIERRIFMTRPISASNPSAETQQGYCGNASNPSAETQQGYCGNASERGSGLGVQYEGNPLPSDDDNPKKATEKRSTQLPEGFQPNDTHKRLAKESSVSLDVEVENFKDHHLAKGSKFKDWDRALNTWLRNAGKFNKRSNVHPFPNRPAPSTDDCGGKVYIPAPANGGAS